MSDVPRKRIVGPRGEVLLFFALLDFVYGYARIERTEAVARAQGDYIGVLRRHINDGQPPPPPPYPSGLIT